MHQVLDLLSLSSIAGRGNVVFIGDAGPLSLSVLFTGAIVYVTALAATQAASVSVKLAMQRYLSPELLCTVELGYLLIDKFGAGYLFQIISHGYEHAVTAVTKNRVYKQWLASSTTTVC